MHFFIEFVFQYKVPNVNKTRGLVAKVADDLWAQIRGMLGTDCRRCSATTDIWSSKLYNDSYIGIDFLFRNNDWEISYFIICQESLSVFFTAERGS